MSRLYIGHLPRDVRERDIERLFKGYGQIRDICLLSGFGFVEFRDRRDADDVMRDFDNREFMGDRLVVEPARAERRRDRSDRGGFDRRGPPPPGRGRSTAPQRTPYRLLVDNLSSSVSWQDLKDFARRAGDVVFADAHKLRTGKGIVEFADEGGLRNALRKLDGEDLNGRRIVLREDVGGSSGGGHRSSRDRSYSPPPGGYHRGGGGYRDDRSFSPPPPSSRRHRDSYRDRSPRSRSRSYSPRSPSYRGRSSYRSRSPPRGPGGGGPHSRSRSPISRTPSRSRSPPRSRSPSRSPMRDEAIPPPPPPPPPAANGTDMAVEKNGEGDAAINGSDPLGGWE